jgi:hypothetical protein
MQAKRAYPGWYSYTLAQQPVATPATSKYALVMHTMVEVVLFHSLLVTPIMVQVAI